MATVRHVGFLPRDAVVNIDYYANKAANIHTQLHIQNNTHTLSHTRSNKRKDKTIKYIQYQKIHPSSPSTLQHLLICKMH